MWYLEGSGEGWRVYQANELGVPGACGGVAGTESGGSRSLWWSRQMQSQGVPGACSGEVQSLPS